MSSAVKLGWMIWESWPPGCGLLTDFMLTRTKCAEARMRIERTLRNTTTPLPKEPDQEPPEKDIQFR